MPPRARDMAPRNLRKNRGGRWAGAERRHHEGPPPRENAIAPITSPRMPTVAHAPPSDARRARKPRVSAAAVGRYALAGGGRAEHAQCAAHVGILAGPHGPRVRWPRHVRRLRKRAAPRKSL